VLAGDPVIQAIINEECAAQGRGLLEAAGAHRPPDRARGRDLHRRAAGGAALDPAPAAGDAREPG
jgi:hypothetical protein